MEIFEFASPQLICIRKLMKVRKVIAKIEKWKTSNENECVIIQLDYKFNIIINYKFNIMFHFKFNIIINQMITQNEKKVIIRSDDNSGRNVENIINQIDDNIYITVQQDDNTKRL
jgi:hypothetical protein